LNLSGHDPTNSAALTLSEDRLIAFLRERGGAAALAAPAPRFDVAHLLWYAGALIVMTAMGLFSTLAFSQMGGEALAVTAVVYAAAFAAAGHYLWHSKNLRTPGGLLIAVAVSMAPLAVYGIQDALGLWGQFGKPGTVQGFYVWIKGSWIFMEIAAIIAGIIGAASARAVSAAISSSEGRSVNPVILKFEGCTRSSRRVRSLKARS